MRCKDHFAHTEAQAIRSLLTAKVGQDDAVQSRVRQKLRDLQFCISRYKLGRPFTLADFERLVKAGTITLDDDPPGAVVSIRSPPTSAPFVPLLNEGADPVIHHTPHIKRKREAQFRQALEMAFPQARWARTDYRLAPETFGTCLLDRDWLIARLQDDVWRLPRPAYHGPSVTRRIDFISRLADCPPQLSVVAPKRRISFDFVIVANGLRYYWEFHEQQHRTWMNPTPKCLFGPDGACYEVPRGLQRLARDVWRTLFFEDYTIVWFDWFTEHRDQYLPALQTGFFELSQPGAFSFTQFCGL